MAGFPAVHFSSVTNPPTGGDARDTALSSTGASPTLAYDAHGNTITLNNETLSYDSSNRHTQTVVGTTTITYKRDATNRIIERDTNVAGATTVLRYLYAGPGDAPWGTTNGAGALVPRQVVGRVSSVSKLGIVGLARPAWTSAGRFQRRASWGRTWL